MSRNIGFVALASLLTLALQISSASAVTLVSDARQTLPDFAKKQGEDVSLYETRYAATGMVICNGVYSTGQLTLRNDMITTAAHAFYDQAGKPRGNLKDCVFAMMRNGERRSIPIKAETLRVGATDPYSKSPVYDWAVVRLAAPVTDVKPYSIGASGKPGMSVVMLANRHRGWTHDGAKAIETCAIRGAQKGEGSGAREIAIDCSAGEGASGSAIMVPGQSTILVGVYVGWRSAHPNEVGPFSPTHMNFGVSLEGAFRSALLEAAGSQS